MQAYQPEILQFLGRIHSFEEVSRSVSMARAAGLNNLNLDLIFGIPGQTLSDWDETLEDHFDLFFAGIGADRVGGGMLGFDTYEGDYYGLEPGWESRKAEETAAEKLKRLTKDQLLRLMGQAFRVAVQFLALRSRYADLKAAMDILRQQNTALLQQVKEIEELYDKAEAEGFSQYEYIRKDSEKALDRLFSQLPDRAWIE